MTGSLLRTVVGRYRVVDFVGAGGMGEVYRVMDTSSGRIAALKVLTAGRGSSMVERFRNEARIHATLQHPGVATMIEFLEADGLPCIAMEFVDGETLEHRLRNYGPMNVAGGFPVFAAIVDVVCYLHQRGVVHRDLKSNNVKIDERGQVKLLDFGIAKSHQSPKLTTDGSVVGTLHYLSPEQLRSGHADARSDIWALGVLLYEMMTGEMPFAGGALGVVTERLLRGQYTPASTLRPELQREVDRIISRALRPNPGDRYASAEALLTDVRTLLPRDVRAPGIVVRSRTTGEFVKIFHDRGPLLASIGAALVSLAFLFWSLQGPARGPGSGSDTVAAGRDSLLLPPAPPRRIPLVQTNELVLGEGTRTSATLSIPGDLLAQVVYQDRVIGTTPFRVRAPVGTEVVLTLRRTGYADERVRFTMTVFDTEFQHVLRPLTQDADPFSADGKGPLSLGTHRLPVSRHV